MYKLFISPLLPVACRYYPSCSQYAKEAIGYYGVVSGTWLALKRLVRCNPLSIGGYDPIPARKKVVKYDR